MSQFSTYFVLFSKYETDIDAADEMQHAFEICRENGMGPKWIKENDNNFVFNKKDVIVFEKFTGEYFESLKEKKIFRILGPRCILTCLLEGISIPQCGTTIYNMCMHGICLSASKFNSAQKMKIQSMVNIMGGIYEKNITEDVNYLVVQSARSEKYKTATQRNIKIVTKEWLEKSWQLSQTKSISAKDIEDDYKCPVFYNLTISCTGFNSEDRSVFSKLISSNGGIFSGKLEVGKTDILICKTGAQSEKMTVAKKSRIPCVSSEWITDSISEGYSLPEDKYLIKMASSTPNKTQAPLDANFSMMSAISSADKNDLPTPTSVGETMLQSLYDTTTVEKRKGEKSPNKSPAPDIVDTIDLKQVKNAGTFLDGCGIYIIGYNPAQRDKICKILKLSGATRYNELSDRVTQVLVADENIPELKTIANSEYHPPVVSTKWLLECITQKHPVFEEPFLIRNKQDDVPRPSSPLSKKGLNLLRHNSSVIEERQPEQMDIEPGPDIDESIKIYMNKKAAEEDTLEKLLQGGKIDTKMTSLDKDTNASISGSMEEETTTNIEQVFEGKSFKLISLDEETTENLAIVIGEMGGKVENDSFSGITDYAVVPVICNQINHTSIEIVNQYWVMECHECEKIVEIEYYHQPMRRLSLNKPLKGCVLGITGFDNSYKRSFLHTVLEDLGAICQDVFAKKSAPSKNVIGSTHLLCGSTEPVSQKLRAAKDWGKLIVSELWVLRCAETDTKLDETPFNPCNSTTQDKVNLETPKRELENSIAVNTERLERINKSKKLTSNESKDKSNGEILKRIHENAPDLLEINQNENTQAKKLKSNNTSITHEKPNSPKNIESEKQSDIGRNLNNETQIEEGSHRISTPIENRSKEPVDKLIKRLKEDGLYDTPSPVPQFRMTPVKEVLEKARMLRPNKKGTPKLNSQRGSQENSPGASQDTPVGKYLRGLKERMGPTELGHNETAGDLSCLSETSGVVRTPDTPLGRFIEENPSPATRKRWQSYLNNIPYGSGRSHPPRNTDSPSWSEEKRKFWARTIHDGSYSEEFSEENKEIVEPQKHSGQESDTQKQVNLQLDHLQNMLRRESLPSKSTLLRLDGTPDKQRSSTPVRNLAYEIHTQVDQVGWDEPDKPIYRKFLLSSFDEKTKEQHSKIIKSLNGELSDMATYDPSTTHLICALPSSNEKCLCFIASGKWILSSKYLHESEKAGRFLTEEPFEISVEDISESKKIETEKEKKQRSLCDAARWWRKKRDATGKCAFFGIKAIVMTLNSSPICRLIEAGGGTVVNAEPPFTHNIDVTHCFLDVKSKFKVEDYVPLAQQGIPCLNIFYLHNYLLKRGETDIKNFYIEALRNYYD